MRARSQCFPLAPLEFQPGSVLGQAGIGGGVPALGTGFEVLPSPKHSMILEFLQHRVGSIPRINPRSHLPWAGTQSFPTEIPDLSPIFLSLGASHPIPGPWRGEGAAAPELVQLLPSLERIFPAPSFPSSLLPEEQEVLYNPTEPLCYF